MPMIASLRKIDPALSPARYRNLLQLCEYSVPICCLRILLSRPVPLIKQAVRYISSSSIHLEHAHDACKLLARNSLHIRMIHENSILSGTCYLYFMHIFTCFKRRIILVQVESYRFPMSCFRKSTKIIKRFDSLGRKPYDSMAKNLTKQSVHEKKKKKNNSE